MDRWIYRQMEICMNRQINIQIDGHMDREIDGHMDGDRWTYGWINRWDI